MKAHCQLSPRHCSCPHIFLTVAPKPHKDFHTKPCQAAVPKPHPRWRISFTHCMAPLGPGEVGDQNITRRVFSATASNTKATFRHCIHAPRHVMLVLSWYRDGASACSRVTSGNLTARGTKIRHSKYVLSEKPRNDALHVPPTGYRHIKCTSKTVHTLEPGESSHRQRSMRGALHFVCGVN